MANRRTARPPARRRPSAGARPKGRSVARKAAAHAAKRRSAGPSSSKSRAAKRRAPDRDTRRPRPAKPAAAAGAGARRVVAPASPPPRLPSAIGLVVQHMDYTCHDLAAVERFYTQVLGFTDSNHDPNFDYLFVRTGPSSSLGFMAPLPGPPEQWRPPREPSIYLIVEDVDRAHRTLVDKGVAFEQGPTDMPWGHRTAVLRDPEGRLLCLAQPIEERPRS